MCKEQKGTTRDEVEWRDCCSLHSGTSSVIYYSTHTRENVARITGPLIDHFEKSAQNLVTSQILFTPTSAKKKREKRQE